MLTSRMKRMAPSKDTGTNRAGKSDVGSSQPASLPGALSPEEADRIAASIRPSWAEYFGDDVPDDDAVPLAAEPDPARAQPIAAPAPAPTPRVAPAVAQADRGARPEPSLKVPTSSSPLPKIIGGLVAAAAVVGVVLFFTLGDDSTTSGTADTAQPAATSKPDAINARDNAKSPAEKDKPAEPAAQPDTDKGDEDKGDEDKGDEVAKADEDKGSPAGETSKPPVASKPLAQTKPKSTQRPTTTRPKTTTKTQPKTKPKGKKGAIVREVPF